MQLAVDGGGKPGACCRRLSPAAQAPCTLPTEAPLPGGPLGTLVRRVYLPLAGGYRACCPTKPVALMLKDAGASACWRHGNLLSLVGVTLPHIKTLASIQTGLLALTAAPFRACCMAPARLPQTACAPSWLT